VALQTPARLKKTIDDQIQSLNEADFLRLFLFFTAEMMGINKDDQDSLGVLAEHA